MVSSLSLVNIEPRRDDKSGFVYVWAMLVPGCPVFKIGKAMNVYGRLDTMTTLPYGCILLFALWSKEPLAQERYLHNYLAEYRLRGEWFRLPDDVLEQFHGLAKVMNKDVPEWARPQLQVTSMDVWRIYRDRADAEDRGDTARVKELLLDFRRAIGLSEEEIRVLQERDSEREEIWRYC